MKRRFFLPLGFTLIELLVVISIILLVAGGTVAGYSSFNNKQTLVSAGQTLKNTLRDAQSRAFTGEKTANCAASTLEGWIVDLTNKRYSIKCDSGTYAVSTFTISSQVTIVPSSTILFTSFPKGATPQTTICLSQSTVSEEYRIDVDVSGNIDDQGLVASANCP